MVRSPKRSRLLSARREMNSSISTCPTLLRLPTGFARVSPRQLILKKFFVTPGSVYLKPLNDSTIARMSISKPLLITGSKVLSTMDCAGVAGYRELSTPRSSLKMAANDYMQNKALYNRDSETGEKAEDGKKSENAVVETVNSLASIYIISLDASEDFEVEDQKAVNVEQRTEFMQVRKHMRNAIGTLPEKEKMLIMMYYFQNRTLEEVGERLGLSKSWTSRLHARALSLLFKRIRNRAINREMQGGEEA